MQPVYRDEKVFPSKSWIGGLEQVLGWLRISRPSSDLWGKLITWMGDWVTKRQAAPDEFLPFPASRAFGQYIHKHHAND